MTVFCFPDEGAINQNHFAPGTNPDGILHLDIFYHSHKNLLLASSFALCVNIYVCLYFSA